MMMTPGPTCGFRITYFLAGISVAMTAPVLAIGAGMLGMGIGGGVGDGTKPALATLAVVCSVLVVIGLVLLVRRRFDAAAGILFGVFFPLFLWKAFGFVTLMGWVRSVF